MPNNNLANISMFENLQNQANASLGNSQMSMFNDHNNKDMMIANIDKREVYKLTAVADNVTDDIEEYKKAIAQNDTAKAETIKTNVSAKTSIAISYIIEFEKMITETEKEIKHNKQEIQRATNKLKTAKQALNKF